MREKIRVRRERGELQRAASALRARLLCRAESVGPDSGGAGTPETLCRTTISGVDGPAAHRVVKEKHRPRDGRGTAGRPADPCREVFMDPVQALQDAADLAREHGRDELAEGLLEARDEARDLQEEARALRRRVHELEAADRDDASAGEREGATRDRESADDGEEGDDRGTTWRGRQ